MFKLLSLNIRKRHLWRVKKAKLEIFAKNSLEKLPAEFTGAFSATHCGSLYWIRKL